MNANMVHIPPYTSSFRAGLQSPALHLAYSAPRTSRNGSSARHLSSCHQAELDQVIDRLMGLMVDHCGVGFARLSDQSTLSHAYRRAHAPASCFGCLPKRFAIGVIGG